METVLDYAGGVPSAAAIKAGGHIGAVRYIAPDRTNGSLPGKPVHRAEVDDFDAHGLKMAMVWQYGKVEDADVRRGRKGGVEDAKAAQAHLDKIRASDHPVYFAVDYDITLSEWNSFGVEYFRGAASVLGKQRVGIYGHSRVCHWAGPEDDVVARVVPGRWLCWVTKGYSRGATGRDYAVLYQRIVDTRSNPGPQVGGVTVDVSDVYHPEWGWRPLDEYQPPKVDVSNLPRFDEYLTLRQDRWMKGRNGRKIEYITRHHMGGIGDGRKCIEWWQNRAASAHAAISPRGKRDQIIAPEDTAYANADWESNLVSYAIEHSNDSGAPGWSISEDTLREGAYLAAEVCLSEDLGRPLFGKNIRDHCEFTSTECPYHLRFGHKYHNKWMKYAQDHYDALTRTPVVAATPPTFLESLMSNNVQSFINPEKSFPAGTALSLIDASNWRQEVLNEALLQALGIDTESILAAAIEADNAGEDRTAAIRRALNLKET